MYLHSQVYQQRVILLLLIDCTSLLKSNQEGSIVDKLTDSHILASSQVIGMPRIYRFIGPRSTFFIYSSELSLTKRAKPTLITMIHNKCIHMYIHVSQRVITFELISMYRCMYISRYMYLMYLYVYKLHEHYLCVFVN